MNGVFLFLRRFTLHIFFASILSVVGAQSSYSAKLKVKGKEPRSNDKSVGKTLETTHWGADQSKLNRKTRIVELRGNAYLSRNYEHLEADEIDYNIDTEYAQARGRVRYQFGEYYVKADAIDLDLRASTGTVYNGNISNGHFALRGKQMDKIEPQRFLIKDYTYTTCFDCPNSWEMSGKQADVKLEGYAYIDNFVFKVKEGSLFWLPYMVVPIKNKRQSGFLFPRWGLISSIYGAYYVQPYFWAINDWSDMTFFAGTYSNLGTRLEWEGRYALTPGSFGSANFYYTRDPQVPKLQARYAGKVNISQELPWGFDSKLRAYEVSDSGYPITYSDDVPGRGDAVLSSDFFVSRSDNSPV